MKTPLGMGLCVWQWPTLSVTAKGGVSSLRGRAKLWLHIETYSSISGSSSGPKTTLMAHGGTCGAM